MTRTEATPRFATPRNPNRQTLGRKVGRVMSAIDPPRRLDGIRGPMPWQQDALDVACEIDPATGYFWYREVVIIVPRQAGKTSLSRGKITHRAITSPRSPILYTAQDRNMARRRLEKSFLDPLTASPLAAFLAEPAAGRGKRGWDGANGREKVKFANGSEIFIIAAQKKSAGHGDTLPEAHLDEYFAQVDGRLEQAVGPTMITVPGAQRWVTSAAGDADSVPLWSKVEAGRARFEAGVHGRTCFIEYSAVPGSDRTDPDGWAAIHPAVGFTIELDDIAAEQQSMDDTSGPEEFDRAYRGVWPTARTRPWVIPQGSWGDCKVAEDDVDWDGEPVWAIDVAPERDWSAIGMAGRTPGARAWLEVVAHEQGTGWVVSHLKQLRAQFGGDRVALDGSGPAGALAHDLVEAGFEVLRMSRQQKVDACGALYDDALAGVIRHGGDKVLDDALAGAKKARSGDAWVWARISSDCDVTPLYVVTLARWLWVETHGEDYDVLKSTM